MGLRLAVASIDDLYLPWARRREVLAGNPFGVARVPPGSHDVALLLEQLDRWRAGSPLRLPRFDKTLAEGQGDRSGWRQLEVDALILEGWLMGCRALGANGLANGRARIGAAASAGSPRGGAPVLTPAERDWLPRWDRELEAYAPLWQACDGLWVLRPDRWELPLRWRLQAEARQRRGGGGWLAAREVEHLVRASLCSLPPQLYQDPLVAGWPGEEGLRLLGAVELDSRRRCRAGPTQFSPSSASSEIG
jgi:D-glycerate 3-kinase